MAAINTQISLASRATWAGDGNTGLPWAWRVRSKRCEVIGYCATRAGAEQQASNTARRIAAIENGEIEPGAKLFAQNRGFGRNYDHNKGFTKGKKHA